MIYLGYNENGQLSDINTQSGETLHYNYDGFLLKSESINGLNAFEIAYDYNDDFTLSQIKLTDNSANYDINLSYDNDNLLTELNINNNNNLLITRDLLNGLIKSVESGNIKESKLYNEYGDLSENKVVYNNNEIDKANYQFDLNGKVIVKTEKENGILKTKKYEYNSRSQIEYVKDENNEIIERFAYDSNGNRFVCENISGNCSVSINAIYDKEDKLINWGDKTFSYNQNGQLQSCSGQSCAVNQYFYDNFGNLRKAILKNGDVIEYVIDGKNRITGKKVNNVVTKKYVYKDLLNPIAELDENNNIQTIFIYGSDKESPDLIYKPNNPANNQLFRVIKDNIGSIKKVISQNGEIVQEINYDTFGKVILNTSPDFQPFTLAGGIYDNDTKLVRFGARDYDAETGRWTSKDPIKFNGGRNFYSYCSGNPISKVDVNGLEESLIDGFLGLANLIASDIMSDYKFPFKNAKLWGIPFGTPISSGWAWIIGDFVIGYGGVIYDITVNDMSFMDAMGNYRGILGIVGRQLGTLLIEQAVMCYDKWDNYLFDTFSWVDINNTNLNYKDYVKNINELETLKKQKSKKNYSKYPIIKSPYDNY